MQPRTFPLVLALAVEACGNVASSPSTDAATAGDVRSPGSGVDGGTFTVDGGHTHVKTGDAVAVDGRPTHQGGGPDAYIKSVPK
jgi:hypothetical protein